MSHWVLAKHGTWQTALSNPEESPDTDGERGETEGNYCKTMHLEGTERNEHIAPLTARDAATEEAEHAHGEGARTKGRGGSS